MLLVFLGIALVVVLTAVLMNSLGDTAQSFITSVQTSSVEIPSPPDRVAAWPLVGKKLYETWSRAHDDLPGLVQSLQPKIGELARAGLGLIASIAGAMPRPDVPQPAAVKSYATRAGLDARGFSGHSLRAGFCTSAAEHGASIFKMMDASWHRSVDTLRGYVRRPTASRITRAGHSCNEPPAQWIYFTRLAGTWWILEMSLHNAPSATSKPSCGIGEFY